MANLDKLQQEIMAHLREQLSDEQRAELDELQDSYSKELRLQLQALQLTLKGVHQSQLKVIREDLAAAHQKDKDEMEKKLWERHKKDVVNSEAEWFMRMQEMSVKLKNNYVAEKEEALKVQAEQQREDMRKVVDRLSRTEGYLKKLKENRPGEGDIERFLAVEQENEKLATELEQLRLDVHGNQDQAPLEASEREELQSKVSQLEEQLQASWSIMTRLRAEDGGKDFSQLPTDVKELQLHVSEMEVEVRRLETACAHEQDRLTKETTVHKEEVASLQSQLDAARAELLDKVSFDDEDYDNVRAKLTQHYDEKQEELICAHQRAMSDLREEHAREIEAMKDRHRDETAAGNGDVADDDRPHVNGHSNDAENTKEEFIKEREQLERSWEAERESLNEKITKLEAEIERVKDGHLVELEEIKINVKEELLAVNMRKLESMTDELERSHMSDLDEQKHQLQLQYQELIDRLQEELRVKDDLLDNRVQELQEKHEHELAEVRKEAERLSEDRVSQAKDDIAAEHTEQLSAAALDTDSATDALVAAHTQELQDLIREHKNNLDTAKKKLTDKHEQELEELGKQNEAKMEKLNEAHATEMEALKKEHEDKLAAIRKENSEDAGIRAKLEARVSLLQEELQAAEEALDRNGEASDEVAELKERLADRTEQIERLSKQLGEKNEELEQTHTLADDLEQKLDEQKQEHQLLIGRFNREQEEEDNLMTMLKADLEKANSEKESTNSTNEKLRNILSDTVMNSMNLEERMTRQMSSLVNEGRHRHGPNGAQGGLEVEETFMQENSSVSDEGLDLSQRISESLFIGPDIDTDVELVADSGNRLQAAIDNLLDLVAMTTRQLQEAQETQRGLAETVEARNAELESLSAKVEDLDQHLKDETDARQFLAVELNKAEGLADGYATEKRHLEDNISGLEEKRAMLVVELERSQSRLSELQEAESTVAARQAELERQKEALEASVGMEDQGNLSPRGLLAENNRLNEEKREFARQYASEMERLSTRVRELEEQIEELESDNYQRLEDKKAEVEDLEKQIEVLDKKLKSNQQFLEEQAVEREQEREDFQKEIQGLQAVVKDKERQEGHESRLQREVADLEEQLKEKIDSHSQLSLKKEQLDRDLDGQQTVLQGQTELIRHLEEELDVRAKNEKQLQQKMGSLQAQLSTHEDSSLEPPDTPTGTDEVDDLHRQILDLEAQIEHLQKNDELLRQQKQQLEEQLINLKTLEEELIQAKEALQQQVYDQLNQISTLKGQVDDMKLGVDYQEGSVVTEMRELRRLLQQEKETTENKERELLQLADQLNQIRELVVEREDQLQQMEQQLSSADSERQGIVAGIEKKLKQVTQENNSLKSQVATLRDNAPSSGMPVFAQGLIDEKNAEIDELNAELTELRDQLKNGSTEGPITASVARSVAAQPAGATSIDEREAGSREIWKLRDELERKNAEIEELQEAVRNGGGDMRESPGPDLSDLVAQVRRLEEKLEDKQAELDQTQQAVSGHRDDMTTLQEVVSAKEALLSQMASQVSSLQGEVEHLNDFQAQLQEDYDMVQTMLEKKQQEIEALSKELEDARPQAEGISADVQAKYEDQVSQLEEALKKQQHELEKREEDLFVLREKLHKQEDKLSDLRSLKTQLADMEVTLVEKNSIISRLEDRLHAIHPDSSPDVSDLQRKISDQGEEIERLHSQLQKNAHPLTERVSEFNRAMQELDDQKRLVSEPSVEETEIVAMRKEGEQTVPSLGGSHGSSAKEVAELREQLRTATMQLAVLRASQNVEGSEQFEWQLSQLKSSHAEDVRHLKQQHAADVDATRRDMQKLHHEGVNRLLSEHERELQRWRHAMENHTDDESLLELGSRLQTELDHNEHLDSRLISLSQEHLLTNGDADMIDGELTERLKAVLEKVHREGVRVLSLSELQLLQRHQGALPSALGAMPAPESWQEERRSLVAALQSLQDLLGRLQGQRDVSKPDTDWRADLMRVVGAILSREREELLSNLGNHAQRSMAVNDLATEVKELDARHTQALKQVSGADRRSLLGEIQDLRQRLTSLRAQRHDESARLREDVNRLHDEYNKKERQLKRQMELLEYRVQQERVVAEDLRSSLEVEKSRTLELSSQLSREKGALNDLQNDLEDTQNQITKLQHALEREQNRLLGASNALDEERNATATLNKALTMEQASSNQINEELEDERRRNQRNQDRHAQAIERLKHDLAHEKDRRGEMGETLEHERIALASAHRELTLEKDQHRGTDHKYKAKVAEMRAALEMEKARCDEANSALQRERQLNNQLREILDEERGSLQETSERERLNITEMQAMLDLERGRLVELQTNLERERAKVHDLNNILEVQKAAADDELQSERTTCRHLKNTIDGYQVEKQDLARQLQFESEKSVSLATDCTLLQQSLLDAKERLRQLQGQRDAERIGDKQRQRDQDRVVDNERHRQGELETQVHTLRQKVTDLELQLAEVKRSEIQTREERDLERLRSTLSPHRSRPSSAPGAREAPGRAASMPGRGTPRHTPEREVGPPQDVSLQRRELEALRQRMQLLVVRHQEELARSTARMPDGERRQRGAGLELLRKALKNVSSELEKIHSALTEREFSECVTGLNEMILVQNSELTSLVSQLSEEKHQVISRLNQAQGELRQAQERSGDTDRARELSERLSSERASWARDQAALTMQLHAAEKEALRLKNEQRHLEIQLEREREKYFSNQSASVPADKEKMQRLYGKYLRAESFRKALVYQKKYLLLLLGGFQDCEEATLSMIAKLGGHPNERDLDRGPPDPLTRFRSAARVVVALTRMKFLVRKWRRATRVGSSVVAGNSAQSHSGASSGYVPTASSFTPARKAVMSGSGRVSFQTPPTRERPPGADSVAATRRQIFVNGAENGFGGPGDDSPSAEGDASLSAYIEQLESLQVRLGTVTQGSNDYSQAHR